LTLSVYYSLCVVDAKAMLPNEEVREKTAWENTGKGGYIATCLSV
jgi:hypothetical protein